MTRLIALLVMILSSASASATICVYVPFEQQLAQAQIVFVATVVSARSDASFDSLAGGATYKVSYVFKVRERIKGDPDLVTALFTNNQYNAYQTGIAFDGDETRLLPGDNVLVVADSPGEVQIASCAASRVWEPSPSQLELVRSYRAAL